MFNYEVLSARQRHQMFTFKFCFDIFKSSSNVSIPSLNAELIFCNQYPFAEADVTVLRVFTSGQKYFGCKRFVTFRSDSPICAAVITSKFNVTLSLLPVRTFIKPFYFVNQIAARSNLAKSERWKSWSNRTSICIG